MMENWGEGGAYEKRKNEKVKNYAVSETVKYKKIKKILEGTENDE